MSKNKNTTKIMDDNWDEILVQYRAGVSIAAIARKFNVLRQALSARLTTLTKKSATTLSVKGTSTLYDEHGNIKIQWVKEDKSKANELESFKLAVNEFIDNPRIVATKVITSPSKVDSQTMSIYAIGDAHIGLLSWGRESGEDYDTTICVADLLSAIDLLVEQAHPSEEAFIIDTGDFYHMDSQDNTTTKGTRVDVDSRFAKIIQAGLDIAVSLIEKALQKHNVVHWRSAIGNHNAHSSLYVTSFVKAWFRNDPRVIVHDTPSMFMYHVFGKNLIGITHGHTVKAEKLGEIMSVDCKNQWSASEHRYFYLGHVHHQQVKEFTNCVVETFNTLTAKDAWHTGQGYRSKQSMKSITLHKEYGEISRNTVSQALVRNQQSN